MKKEGKNVLSKKRYDGKKGIGIQMKLLGVLIPVIVVVMVVMITLVQLSTSKILLEKSENLLEVSTDEAISKVESWMNTITSALQVQKDTLISTGMDRAEQLAYLRHTVNQYDTYPDGIYFADTESGKLVHSSFVPDDSYKALETTWYKSGVNSEKFTFGATYVDALTGDNVVSASAAMKDADGKMLGVAAADVHLDAISQIVNDITIEQSGGAFLVDGLTNMIIGHKDTAAVGSVLTDLTDKPLYINVAKWISNNEMGLREFTAANGMHMYVDLKKVPDSDWVAVTFVPSNEVLSGLTSLTRTMVFLAVMAVLILSLFTFLCLRKMVIAPVKQLDDVASKIAEGDLTAKLEYNANDEFGTLCTNFGKTVTRLHDYVNYIDEIAAVLNEVADGELDYTLTYDYAGEFAKIKKALENISTSFNVTLLQINESSDQVSAGADQLASGAQALSQGATEQAAEIQQLVSAIGELSDQIKNNAQEAQSADRQVNEVSKRIVQSNEHMQQLISAMEKIADSSRQIDHIIKTIEDIAFQTNILALNAAVEAARAGEAGKGFAVVADEVRNLANKSDEAAKSTAALIQQSEQAVQEGTGLADDTAQSLLVVVSDIEDVTKMVSTISKVSDTQASSIANVSHGVEQVAVVVHTNSATAEETAASSEELSSQAQLLKQMVGRFHLKKNAGE